MINLVSRELRYLKPSDSRHPPGTIACLPVRLRLGAGYVSVIFNSHTRPSYHDGAVMTVSISIEGIARTRIRTDTVTHLVLIQLSQLYGC